MKTPLMDAMDAAIETALSNMWHRDKLRFLMTHTGRTQLKAEMASQGKDLQLSAIEPESFRGIPIDTSGMAAQAFQQQTIGKDFDLVGVQPK